MTGLLEVIVRHAADAERATTGGADRLEIVGSMDYDGLSPEPALVGQIRRATGLPIRVMVRLREGFGTDGGEVVRLRGLAEEYLGLGADGLVLGFLNGHTDVDAEVVAAVIGPEPDFGWTFHRAIDSCISGDRAWRTLRQLPGLDQVLTAGSARSVTEGLDELVTRARTDPFAAKVIMAGGGLLAEHIPWLARAGVTAFHLGTSVRPDRSWKAYIDSDLVRSWRRLIDDAVSARGPPAEQSAVILIDAPNWPGHGRYWSHLVSDSSVEELHAFAAGLGIPRRAFDRDHYDVPEQRVADCVAAGATMVRSRDLVVALRQAGLRRPKRSRLAG